MEFWCDVSFPKCLENFYFYYFLCHELFLYWLYYNNIHYHKIHPLKCIIQCVLIYLHAFNLFYFKISERNAVTISNHSPSSVSLAAENHYLLFVSLNLSLLIFHIDVVIQYLASFTWHMFLWFIHVATHGSALHSFLWTKNILLHGYTTFCLSIY